MKPNEKTTGSYTYETLHQLEYSHKFALTALRQVKELINGERLNVPHSLDTLVFEAIRFGEETRKKAGIE